MSDRTRIYALLVCTSALLTCAAIAQTPARTESIDFFEKRIRPVLVKSCFQCHGGGQTKGGFSLETRGGVLAGGKSGPAVVLGKPEESVLIQALRQTHARLKMPPTGKLPDSVIVDFEKWVAMGLTDPRESMPKATAAGESWQKVLVTRKNWWSLKPVRRPPAPKDEKRNTKNENPIDSFIMAKLVRAGLMPAPQAERSTLIRRAYLTLIGLPPTPQELAEAANDRSPGWYERLVDRLLASPHFGERWARHWMDVVRFGETHGYEWNYEVKEAWRYRDYLVRAFNQDVPYDQLVREHIAGDLLPNPRINTGDKLNESVIGTAFYRFGEVGHDDFIEIGYDVIDNQIDTLSKAFQAATIACARCHDHKLDAVATRDYYALVGILTSSRQIVQTIDSAEVNAEVKKSLRALKPQIRAELASQWVKESSEVGRYLLAAQAAKDKAADAAQRASGLDANRLKKVVAALEAKDPRLEDLHYPWITAAAAKDGTESAWKALGEKYQSEGKQRTEFNVKHFTPFGDFRTSELTGWRADGMGLLDGPSPSGDFSISLDGDTAVSGIFPAGLYTHALSERMNGSLRSPFLPKGKSVSLQVMGGKFGTLRTIPDFRQLADVNQEVKRDHPGWIRIGQNERNTRNYVELVTKSDNPRVPERGTKDKSKAEDPRSYFGIVRAVLSDSGEPPKDELTAFSRLFADPIPRNPEEMGNRYAEVARRATEAWAAGRASDEDSRWLDWFSRIGLLSNSSASGRLSQLVMEYRAAEKKLSEPRVIAAMGDLEDTADHVVFVRGDYKQLGDTVPRRYAEAYCGPNARRSGTGSGRLDLALTLSSPTNPLTARVMVNRLWYHLFGSGIVRTVDDFGHLGDLPSHPELLDWLAAEFIGPTTDHRPPTTEDRKREKKNEIAHAGVVGRRSSVVEKPWSIKRMIRLLVTSDTFKMSGRGSEDARVKDPDNRLLQHYPSRRLEAEAIRDSILTVSARLDRAMYGESIDPYREKPNPERKLISGPLDGNGRRSIYTRITLMELPKFLTVFNLPDAKAAQGKRDVTNVPAQALALLNDPFVINQAEFWGKRLAAESDPSVSARIRRMYLSAVSRQPEPIELSRFEGLVRQLAELHSVPADEILKNPLVWKDTAHAVFNLKEFVYIR